MVCYVVRVLLVLGAKVTLSQDEGKDTGTGPKTCGFSPERLGVPGRQDEKRLAGLKKGGEGRGQAPGGRFLEKFRWGG